MPKKLLKITGIFIGLFFILISLAIILFRIYSPNYFIPYVIKQVQNETNGRYTLAINSDSVKVNILTMNLNLGLTEFKRDSSIYDNSGIELLDKFDVHAQFESLNVSALHLLTFIFSKKIRVKEVVIEKPTIIVRENIDYRPDEFLSKDTPTKYATDSVQVDTLVRDEFRSLLKVAMPPVRIENYRITQASFALYGGRTTSPVQEIHGLNLSLVGFVSDEIVALAYESVSIQIDSASALVSQFLAQIKVVGVHIHTDSVHIDYVQLGHYVDPYRINKIMGFRTSWVKMDITDISIKGIHPEKLLSDSILNVDKTSIKYAKLYVFRDKEEPAINPAYKALPTELIRDFPIPVLVDTFEIANGDLVIDMEAPKAMKPGRLLIDDIEVQILNITNIPTEIQKNPSMKFHALFEVEDSMNVDLNVDFNISSTDDSFFLNCDVQPFQAPILNDFLGGQFFIEFSTGTINSLHFEFEGNNKANVGTMDMEYANLAVRKLQEYQKYIDGKPKTGFVSGIGNMLIPRNRSIQDKNYKQAVIYYEKEYNRDFIHGTILSLVSGISSSVGFGSKNLEKKEGQANQLDESAAIKSKEKAQQKANKAEKKKHD